MLRPVGRARDEQLLPLQTDLDVAVLALRETAAGASDVDGLGLDGNGDAGGDRNGLLANAGHNRC